MRGEKSYRKPSRLEEYGEKRLSKSRSLGVFILVLALFIFQAVVFVVNKVSPEEVAQEPDVPELFEFDPNTITLDSLCMLGLSPRQAMTIVNYREKGGDFKYPEDFARMYVVSDEFYTKVLPYIHISPAAVVEEKGKSVQKRSKSVPEKRVPIAVGKRIGTIAKKSEECRHVVELNGADSVELVKLYGIGPYYAKKIIGYRRRLGGYHSAGQLMEIKGIDSARFEGFAKYVVADSLKIRQFSLDTAGKEFLAAHPYIGAYAARGIILLREKLGREKCTLENLVREHVLTLEKAEKLRPYINLQKREIMP
ncbi:MAG: helix-hairpin-helix domain-containing protein [Bacteroidales bacterium]|nr:helix-hairpin-helix domain-containing protein [Bacteroidales bacterium]